MPNLQDFLSHPIESLEKALQIRKQIESLQKQLHGLFGGHPPSLDAISAETPEAVSSRRKGKRTMSVSARAKISSAQRARWAKKKGTVTPTPAAKTKKKRGMSAKGRAAVSAAQKARWAKSRAAKA